MFQTTAPSGRRRRTLLGAGLLTAGLLAAASPAPAAHAALARCGSDPIVYLSNGIKVDLTATLSTDRSDVKRIAYQLHVPAGAQVTKVVYTAGEIGRKEVVTVVNDATGPYVADSVAETYAAPVPVNITMSVLDQSGSTKTLVTQVTMDPSIASADD